MPRAPARSLLADTRGAAFVEALILVGFLSIGWTGMHWVHKHAEQRLVAMERARACSWYYAAGCCEVVAQQGCALQTRRDLEDMDLAGSVAAVDNLRVRLQGFRLSYEALFGPFFRPAVESQGGLAISRPELIGGGKQEIRVSTSTSCGEPVSELDSVEVARRAFCRLTGWCERHLNTLRSFAR